MPKLYVGTYKKYNEGSIKGAWLDLSDYADSEEFLTACAELHNDESDPEFMFQDYEDMPASLYSESGIDQAIWDYMDACEDMGEDVVNAACDLDIPLDRINDAYAGSADSETDYAEQYADDTGMLASMPENLRFYFDFERFARDLFMCDMNFINGRVFYANW